MDQNILIFENCTNIDHSKLLNSCSRKLYLEIFKFDANLKIYDELTKEQIVENNLLFADPYIIQFLKQTRQSAIFDRKHISQYVNSKIDGLKIDDDIFKKVDDLYSKLGTIIILLYDKFNKDPKYDLYIKFLENTMCKVLSVDINDDVFNNTCKIISFIDMHNKIKNYRNLFFKKLVNCSNIVGDRITFITEGDFDYLTKNDIKQRLSTKDPETFEFICNKQFKKSDTNKLMVEIFSRTKNIHKFESSTIQVKKSDFETISKFDIKLMESEIRTLKPQVIITFSKHAANFVSKLEFAKFSKIKNLEVPIVYSNELFDNIANEIDLLVK
jgi:hypothetical protein|tara:strand:- start:2346 stop:3329 length:984 start_codon:yes stop_codon:yes gene_type:complete